MRIRNGCDTVRGISLARLPKPMRVRRITQMKTVKIASNIGNFAYELSVNVEPQHEEILVAEGLTRTVQHISEVDDVLGIRYKVGKKNVRKDGKEGRPKVTRNDVPYSDTVASALQKLLSRVVIADAKNGAPEVALPCDVIVTLHDRDDDTSKEAQAMAVRSLGNHESAGDLEEWLASAAKYEGPTHTANEEAYHPDAIAAVIPLCRAHLAAKKAALKLEKL